MPGRKFFSFFTDRWSVPPSEGEQLPRRKVSISRSGRFKEEKRKRLALNESTFNPDHKTGSDTNCDDRVGPEENNNLNNTTTDWEAVVESIATAAMEGDIRNDELERRKATLSRIRTQINRERKETPI